MTVPLVIRQDDGPITSLILNRPEKLNSLNSAVFLELDQHVREIAGAATPISCVILRGAGRCFSAGHDLGDINEGETTPDLAFQSSVVERLANLPQAVITAVHGHCYTGALELALAGDIILASVSARFADTHAKWSLTPVWGMTQRLPRRVGFGKAREMMFTARTYTGAESVEMGLANLCFNDSEFDDKVMEFARGIAANSPFSIAAYKKLMADTDGLPLRFGLAHEVHNSEGVGRDMNERIARFMNRKG